MRSAIVGVHDCNVSGLQVSHERRKDTKRCDGARSSLPRSVSRVILYRSHLELNVLSLEYFGDRPVRMMQHNQGREPPSVEIAYEAKGRQMAPSDIVAYERKAHGFGLGRYLHRFIVGLELPDCGRLVFFYLEEYVCGAS